MRLLHHGLDAKQLLRMLAEALHKESDVWRPSKVQTMKVGGISTEERDVIVRWLDQLNKKFEFYPETFFLAVHILDRFLGTVKAHPRYLRCIGVASFYLAAKTLEEDNVLPSTLELMRGSECGCSVDEIHRMERCVLNKLDWDLRTVTALDFLHIFHALLMSNCPHLLDQFTHMTPSKQMLILTSKLRLCAGQHQIMSFAPSTLALAILSLELELFWKDWLSATFTLQSMVQVDNSELIHCREMILCYFKPAQNKVYISKYPVKRRKELKENIPMKRKVQEFLEDDNEKDEEDDIYDGIKRLYNEDTSDGVSHIAIQANTTCGSEVRHDSAIPTALQAVAN